MDVDRLFRHPVHDHRSHGIDSTDLHRSLAKDSNSGIPGGPPATATHVGPYQNMYVTNQAIRRWVVAQGLKPGIDWEVYGDWTEDESKLTTQIYFLVSEGGA